MRTKLAIVIVLCGLGGKQAFAHAYEKSLLRCESADMRPQAVPHFVLTYFAIHPCDPNDPRNQGRCGKRDIGWYGRIETLPGNYTREAAEYLIVEDRVAPGYREIIFAKSGLPKLSLRGRGAVLNISTEGGVTQEEMSCSGPLAGTDVQ